MIDILRVEYPILFWGIAIYGFLAVSKCILALAAVPCAVRVFTELHPEYSTGAAYVAVVLGTLIVGPFVVWSSLRSEGIRFFLAYTEEEVREQMVSAFLHHHN